MTAGTVEQKEQTGPLTEAEFIEMAGAETPEHAGGKPHNTERPLEQAKAVEEPKPKDAEEPAKGSADDDKGSKAEKKDGDEGLPAGDEPPDGEQETDAPTADEVAAFEKAMAEQGIKVAIEELPEAARPLIKKTLSDMNKGFTTKMQEVSAELKAARTFRAEERFRKEKPADFIFAMLAEHPDVALQVNKLIEQTTDNETALAGHKALVENARRSAQDAEERAVSRAEEARQIESEILAMGHAAAKAHGVPFEAGVADGIATAILLETQLATQEKREARRITKEQILSIAKQKAAVYDNLKRQLARDRSGKYVSDKIQDRKAGLTIKPGSGGEAPAPGPKKIPKNDEEFVEQFVAQQGG